ncbi:MAG: hypothetical protein A4E37_00628 [Methanoregulaceae archaeon PtaB.Bin056]|nr:MAG: hypothetical protein A4E37_00628 [Methanoregulaceae archaeon PtaB.Bin056]
MSERPLGVTIIGILWIIGGLLLLLAGLGLAALGAVIAGPIGGVVGLALGFVLIIIGIIEILLGIGCFKAWGWVWTVGVIITIISLVMGIINLFSDWMSGLVSIIISAIILWYLFQANVKAYFGKS